MRFYFRSKNTFMGNFKVSASEFATEMNSWESFANIYQLIFNVCLQNPFTLSVTLSQHFPLLLQIWGFFAASASFRGLSFPKFQCTRVPKQVSKHHSPTLLAALWKVSEAFCPTLKALNPTMPTRYSRWESTFKVNCNLGGSGIELEANQNRTSESEWYFYLNPNKKVTILVSYPY